MDLTAAAFGLLVTALGGLFTAVVLLARRELDRQREQAAELGRRLDRVEWEMRKLEPVVSVLEHNAQVQAERFLKGARRAVTGRA